jgi:GTP cyclohydrolase I
MTDMAAAEGRVSTKHLEALCRELLVTIGEDPDREGLEGTPRRFARWWSEFIEYDDRNAATSFQTVQADQLGVVRGMRVWSICEHHLLPFSCAVSIGYITTDRVLGLSKFARIAHQAAHRLQLQERLAEQIADAIAVASGSPNVAVVASGIHMCMASRGIRSDGEMVTSVVRGSFREDASQRAEFMRLGVPER